MTPAACMMVLFIPVDLGTRGVCESTLSAELCDEECSEAEIWVLVLYILSTVKIKDQFKFITTVKNFNKPFHIKVLFCGLH